MNNPIGLFLLICFCGAVLRGLLFLYTPYKEKKLDVEDFFLLIMIIFSCMSVYEVLIT